MTRQTVSNPCLDKDHEDCGLHAPDGKPCACRCHLDDTPEFTAVHTPAPQTPRMIEIENARQRRQDEARAVADLAGHSQDYYRLPGTLRAIVDAYRWADMAFIEASEAARHSDGFDGVTTEQWALLTELERLAWHTRAELERHGVIEGALAWLAAHPVGWDDEPEPEIQLPSWSSALVGRDQAERNPEAELAELRSEYRPEDDPRHQLDDAEIQARAEEQFEAQAWAETVAAVRRFVVANPAATYVDIMAEFDMSSEEAFAAINNDANG